MDEEEKRVRRELTECGLKAYQNGFVTETEGNLSARVGKDRVLVTPSHTPYEIRVPDDMVLMDMEGNVLAGDRNPTVENRMHLSIFKAREDVGGILHAHPLYSSMLAVAGQPLRPILDEMVPYLGGVVEVADFAPSGSEELAAIVVKTLGPKAAVLMANHGTVCVGKNLSRAYQVTKYVEKWAHIQILAALLGNARAIPEERQQQEAQFYDFLKEADY